MTIKVLAWTAVTVLSLSQASFMPVASEHKHTQLCEGFVEENNLNIPVGFNAGGIDEATFNRVMDRIEKIFTPIIAAEGGKFELVRNWTDGTVNAYAQRIGTTYQIQMFGGLARHPAITEDAMALVACHEVGHHIGGAPKISNMWSNWASNEGQSDYYAGLKCLRLYYEAVENTDWYQKNAATLPALAVEKCAATFTDENEKIMCLRTAMAGQSVGFLFQDLRGETTAPDFSTPDTSAVTKTNDRHPATQCRYDTYFQGGLCAKAVSDSVSQTDYKQGTCTLAEGATIGTRPLCWFKPN